MKTVPPIVLIPGMQCTEQMFTPLISALRHTLPEASVHVRPIIHDDLGSAAAASLEGVRKPAILVGHSLGGTIAMATARMFPDRVAGLALLCANPHGPRPDQIEYWQKMQSDVAAGNSDEVVNRTVSQLLLGEQTKAPGEDFSDWRTACRAMAGETGNENFLAQLKIQLARIDECPALSQFRGPVIAIAAENDSLVKVEDAKASAGAAPDGQFEILPGASHMMPLTSPGSLAAALTEWILYRFMTKNSKETQRVLL